MANKRSRRNGHGRFIAAALALVVGLSGGLPGFAHAEQNGYQTNFDGEDAGPLVGESPADAWEIKAGAWAIAEQTSQDASPMAGSNHVLVQGSRASTRSPGGDAIVFVRGLPFRSFTAQVTTAFMDSNSALGDLGPGTSVGIVFRAPVTNGLADKDNLYLFAAVVTGIGNGFPTGKAYVLFKRVARGYYLLSSKMAHTWADFTKPHDLKVAVGGGHIMAFVDGRMVIDHTDIPSGDQPTAADPLPGLPFESGAVGLETSGTRAWFDNFSVVGNDAYEARANTIDAYENYGEGSQVRRGLSVQLSKELAGMGLGVADSGFRYHDHDFQEATLKPVDNPGGGQPSIGASLRTYAYGGTVFSEMRASGIYGAFADPTGKFMVYVAAQGAQVSASASCNQTSSSVDLQNAAVWVGLTTPAPGVPDAGFGPIPLRAGYAPNTVVFEKPGYFSIIAHARYVTASPRRIEVAALKIVFPEGAGISVPAQNLPVPGGRTPAVDVKGPTLDIAIGQAVAGRYCD